LRISLSAGTALVLPASGRLVDRHGGGIVSMFGGVAAVVTTAPFASSTRAPTTWWCSPCSWRVAWRSRWR
jgi:hypothetical protein